MGIVRVFCNGSQASDGKPWCERETAWMRASATTAMLLAFLLSSPAVSEVMDKEPDLPEIWMAAFIFSCMNFFAARKHPLLGLMCLPLQIFSPAFGMLFELQECDLGAAIAHEAGMSYVWQIYAANLLVFSVLAAGVYFWRNPIVKSTPELIPEERAQENEWKLHRR